MMKRSLLLGWISLFGIWVSAQEDPVVMRINGKEIPRSEFEYSYRRHVDGEGEKLSPKEYAELFIQAKLKVEASRAAGLDTTSAFRKQQEAYRTKLLRSYLPGSQEMDGNARILYQKMKGNVRNGQVQVQQIFKYLPQTITSRHLQEEQARMDAIYQVIQNQQVLILPVWWTGFQMINVVCGSKTYRQLPSLRMSLFLWRRVKYRNLSLHRRGFIFCKLLTGKKYLRMR